MGLSMAIDISRQGLSCVNCSSIRPWMTRWLNWRTMNRSVFF